MKPGPEHVGRLFCDIGGDMESTLVAIENGSVRLRPADGGDEFVMTIGAFSRFWQLADADDATGLLDTAAMLSRLLAAGFEQAELALRAVPGMPNSLVFIGYYKNDRISWIQVAGDADDLPKIEAAVLEKLEAIKSAEGCE